MFPQLFPHHNLISLPQLESSLQLSDSLQSTFEIPQPLQKKASVFDTNLYKAACCEAMHQPFIMLPL